MGKDSKRLTSRSRWDVSWDMQRNEFLDNIGIPIINYGVNWQTGDSEEMSEQRRRYGFDMRETFNLNDTYAEWLYSHLMLYMQIVPRVIDLTDVTVRVKGEQYSLERVLREILELLRSGLTEQDSEKRKWKLIRKATKLWSKVLPWVWW